LTPALLLRGLLVGFGGIPTHGLEYPRVFAKPEPEPVKTRTLGAGAGFHGCGYGLPWNTRGLPVTIPKDGEGVDERVRLRKGVVMIRLDGIRLDMIAGLD